MVAYLILDYLLIGIYGTLVLLALRNIWVIILRQKEYKNLPILMFYMFALVAVVLRTIYLTWYWTPSPFIDNINLVQQAAKLSVGLVKDWITLELAIRIRNSNGYSEVAEAVKKKLLFARKLLFGVITSMFVTFNLVVIASAHKDGNHGTAFRGHECRIYGTIGYIFLS